MKYVFDPKSEAIFERQPDGYYRIAAVDSEARRTLRELRRAGHEISKVSRYWEVDSQTGIVLWRFPHGYAADPQGVAGRKTAMTVSLRNTHTHTNGGV